MSRLNGRIALVTGGLSGIGRAVVERMAAEGAVAIAADLSAEQTDVAASRPVCRVDVSDPASVAAMVQAVVEHYGRLDCVVNSAGIGRDTPFLDTALADFDHIMAVNLRGSFIVGQAAARAMRETGGGSIVNIASVSGMTGNVGRSAYGASKGGVIQLSRVMAVDLANDNIRVNVLAPGPVESPMSRALHTPQVRAQWIERVPMRRYGTAEEMAAVAVFLCSDDASYVTGHVIAVDGGFMGAGLTTGAQ